MPGNPPAIVPWSEVLEAISPARNYWLTTINPDGSPQVSPVWGVVWSEALCFFTSQTTVKARNIARDSRTTIHLESAEDVVIIRGSADDLGEPVRHREIMDALATKYNRLGDTDYLPKNNDSYNVLFRLRPHKALLWRLADFDDSQRRWNAPTPS